MQELNIVEFDMDDIRKYDYCIYSGTADRSRTYDTKIKGEKRR